MLSTMDNDAPAAVPGRSWSFGNIMRSAKSKVKHAFSRRPRRRKGTPIGSLSLVSGTEAAQELGVTRQRNKREKFSASFPVFSQQCQNQRLLTVGSRQWGARALGVRIYDFAIWIDPQQAHQQLNKSTAALPSSPPTDCAEPEAGSFLQWFNNSQQQEHENPASWLQQSLHSFFQLPSSTSAQQEDSQELGPALPGGRPRRFAALQAVQGVDMSLTIRAARNLPVHMLTDEFHKILKRRHATMGGHSTDPALAQIQHIFSPQHMPGSSTTDGGEAVLCGACITFERRGGSELHTFADGHPIGFVNSEKLCDALFDLYLGKQPVSPGAKVAADETLRHLAHNVEHFYRPKLGACTKQKLVCSSPTGDPSSCVVRW